MSAIKEMIAIDEHKEIRDVTAKVQELLADLSSNGKVVLVKTLIDTIDNYSTTLIPFAEWLDKGISLRDVSEYANIPMQDAGYKQENP